MLSCGFQYCGFILKDSKQSIYGFLRVCQFLESGFLPNVLFITAPVFVNLHKIWDSPKHKLMFLLIVIRENPSYWKAGISPKPTAWSTSSQFDFHHCIVFRRIQWLTKVQLVQCQKLQLILIWNIKLLNKQKDRPRQPVKQEKALKYLGLAKELQLLTQ